MPGLPSQQRSRIWYPPQQIGAVSLSLHLNPERCLPLCAAPLQVKDSGIVLFCYPKANTKGCTSQAVGLSEKAEELAAAGYKVGEGAGWVPTTATRQPPQQTGCCTPALTNQAVSGCRADRLPSSATHTFHLNSACLLS